jgi:transcription initiation factor TFIID TATA-box-binding protein
MSTKTSKDIPGEEKKYVKLVNIVISSDLKKDIPLEKMAATLSNTEYNPEQFPGLVLRIKEPKTTALLFSSGKIVLTGAKSLEEVKNGIQEIKNILKKINVEITIDPEYNIQNMVASGNIHMDLNLNSLAMKLERTEYEPEQFPGLVYKIGGKTNATFLLFSNGKIVCTGTKYEAQSHEAVKELIEQLKNLK